MSIERMASLARSPSLSPPSPELLSPPSPTNLRLGSSTKQPSPPMQDSWEQGHQAPSSQLNSWGQARKMEGSWEQEQQANTGVSMWDPAPVAPLVPGRYSGPLLGRELSLRPVPGGLLVCEVEPLSKVPPQPSTLQPSDFGETLLYEHCALNPSPLILYPSTHDQSKP